MFIQILVSYVLPGKFWTAKMAFSGEKRFDLLFLKFTPFRRLLTILSEIWTWRISLNNAFTLRTLEVLFFKALCYPCYCLLVRVPVFSKCSAARCWMHTQTRSNATVLWCFPTKIVSGKLNFQLDVSFYPQSTQQKVYVSKLH